MRHCKLTLLGNIAKDTMDALYKGVKEGQRAECRLDITHGINSLSEATDSPQRYFRRIRIDLREDNIVAGEGLMTFELSEKEWFKLQARIDQCFLDQEMIPLCPAEEEKPKRKPKKKAAPAKPPAEPEIRLDLKDSSFLAIDLHKNPVREESLQAPTGRH